MPPPRPPAVYAPSLAAVSLAGDAAACEGVPEVQRASRAAQEAGAGWRMRHRSGQESALDRTLRSRTLRSTARRHLPRPTPSTALPRLRRLRVVPLCCPARRRVLPRVRRPQRPGPLPSTAPPARQYGPRTILVG